MKSKPLSHITLSAGHNKGFGHCPHRKKWFVSYQDEGKRVREFIDATNRDEARVERDRRYTELAMLGAIRKGETVRPKLGRKPPKEKLDPDFGIRVTTRTLTVYEVFLEGKVQARFRGVTAARKKRDRLLAEFVVKPCRACGKRPSLEYPSEHVEVVHTDCENACRLKSKHVGRDAVINEWNDTRRFGKK